MNYLHHNGVIVPQKYTGQKLSIKVKGQNIKVNDEQEEMAVAWAKKVGTPYVEDSKFAENFHEDFSTRLGLKVRPKDVDYTDIVALVQAERERKKSLPKEVKKTQASERKALKEANKEKYGWALIDGQRIELGNYTVEPNSIFMGRGKHPWRGCWKEGPSYEDIELNLSPDAPKPIGSWKAIVWEPDYMWIARWKDRLSGKMKYVWPGDASFLKQQKDIEKYEKAQALKSDLDKVKAHIEGNLSIADVKRRKTATVCYLIDSLKFRVGDEKDDEDEADTVGASTLRPEHICFNSDETVTFNFLGKDSVPMEITARLPNKVAENLKDFIAGAGKESIFEGINSGNVSDFLKEVMDGLSAKVFRTLYATEAVNGKLSTLSVAKDDPDYVKRHAALKANLEAAIVCNHKRTIPKTWENSLKTKKERLKKLRLKADAEEKKLREKIGFIDKSYRDKLAIAERKLIQFEEKEMKNRIALVETEKKGVDTTTIKKRLNSSKKTSKSAREQVRRIKNDLVLNKQKLKRQLDEKNMRNKTAIERMKLQVEAQEITKDYNLGTSLKNYVDPRIYLDWGRRVGFDWRSYYPTILQKKFSWIEEQPLEE